MPLLASPLFKSRVLNCVHLNQVVLKNAPNDIYKANAFHDGENDLKALNPKEKKRKYEAKYGYHCKFSVISFEVSLESRKPFGLFCHGGFPLVNQYLYFLFSSPTSFKLRDNVPGILYMTNADLLFTAKESYHGLHSNPYQHNRGSEPLLKSNMNCIHSPNVAPTRSTEDLLRKPNVKPKVRYQALLFHYKY
jgi:hypothetical protein